LTSGGLAWYPTVDFDSLVFGDIGMIEKLTEEQEKDLVVWREEFYKVGINTNPADRESAQDAIREMYTRIGKEPPEFIWGDSPKQLLEMIREKGGDPNEALNNCFYGQQECYFEAFYLFCEKIGVKYKEEDSKLLRVWEKISRSCNWWIPADEFCFVSERPEIVAMNSQMRIHNENGPAVKYRGGLSIFAINGVVVPDFVVNDTDKITVEVIRNESNAEIRRIMISRYSGGIGKYLDDCKAKVLDVDTLTIPGSATRALMEDSTGEKWLVGSDGSTKRVYFMSVPRNSTTCKKAHNAICGFDESRIKMEA